MTVLERIDMLRKERGWSVNYLAMEAGLTQSTLNNLYCRKAEPKISTLRAVCDACGISLTEFFEVIDGEKEENDREKEIKNRVSSLTDVEKDALLVLLRAMKNNKFN